MNRRVLCGVLATLTLLALLAPAAGADEPLKQGLDGSFVLKATNGYKLSALIGSTGEGDAGLLILSVAKKGSGATYLAHGEVTKEHVHFDLGSLGAVDLAVQRTGRKETVTPACGEPVPAEGLEYTGTIEFHGEEGFTEASATRAQQNLKPVLDIVCPGPAEGGTSNLSAAAVQLEASLKGGPKLGLAQKRPGARVFYSASVEEREGALRVERRVAGALSAKSFHAAPSIATATLTGTGSLSGKGTYAQTQAGKRPRGTWQGNLKVDFPGRASVPIAGPGFKASLTHPFRTN
jgi:hypothetical protein